MMDNWLKITQQHANIAIFSNKGNRCINTNSFYWMQSSTSQPKPSHPLCWLSGFPLLVSRFVHHIPLWVIQYMFSNAHLWLSFLHNSACHWWVVNRLFHSMFVFCVFEAGDGGCFWIKATLYLLDISRSNQAQEGSYHHFLSSSSFPNKPDMPFPFTLHHLQTVQVFEWL